MDTPQEVQVWILMPAVRREFVFALKKTGKKQSEIAKLMGLTQSAVSQYIKGKRGAEHDLDDETKSMIKTAVKTVTKQNYRKVQHDILKYVGSTKHMCKACHKFAGTAHDCNICFR